MVFKYKRKPDWTINKFKAQYCERGGFQKIMSPEPLNSYSPVVWWDTVRSMLIFQFLLDLKSHSIDFTNGFDQAYIPSGDPVFIQITKYFVSD